jgi:hypothetical protein
VLACVAVLAVADGATATDALMAVQAAMRLAAARRPPRKMLVTGRE